jgi:ADP-heptose:LPS heptosyltransferase
VRLGAVGDVARTLPAAARLRAAWPGAHLAWLVEPAAASLVAAEPWIDETLVFPRPRRGAFGVAGAVGLARELAACLGRLRARRFDLVVDFHSILRSALLALATGARRRAGFAPPFGRELAWLLATHRARIAPARVSRFERNEGLARFLGAEAEPALRPLHVDPARVAAMRAQLGPGPAPVAIHPGTSDATAHKRAPAAVLARAAGELFAELGLPAVVTRGPARDDAALAEEVVAAASGAARLAPPTPGLPDLAALLAAARLALGPDTGPLHLAALAGTPVVQLVGPTDPVENATWPGTPSRTLRLPRDARAPGRAADELAAAIVAAARALLASPRSGRAASRRGAAYPPAAAPGAERGSGARR